MPYLYPDARACLARSAVGFAQSDQLHARDIEYYFLAGKFGLELAELCTSAV